MLSKSILGIGGTIGPVIKGFPGYSDGYAGSLSCTREVSAVSGDCMMVARDIFREFGGFREIFSPKYQTIDLALKLFSNRKRILFTPRAVLRYQQNYN